jgi:hypothetical protein
MAVLLRRRNATIVFDENIGQAEAVEISFPARLTLSWGVDIRRHLPGQAVCRKSGENAVGKPV